MSGVKKRCQLDGCNRAASTRCYCCNKSVCTSHFTEHIDAVKAQIDPVANDINTMVEKIQGLTIEQLTEKPLAELQQWEMNMHKLIDEIFFDKIKEIKDLVENNKDKFAENKKQQLETMMKIQDDVKQLVDDGDATLEQIQSLKNQLANVETNLTSFRNDFLLVNTLVFGQGLVAVSSKLNKPPVNQNQLPKNLPPPLQKPVVSTSPTTLFSSTFGTTTTAGANSTSTTPTLPSFSFGGFGAGGFQPNPSKQPTATNAGFPFSVSSAAVPSPFSASPSASSLLGNNPPPFINPQSNVSFSFGNKGKK